MVEYGGSIAGFWKEADGSYRMDLWNPNVKHPRTEPYRVTLKPAGGVAEIGDDEQGQWSIYSLQCATLEDRREEDSVIPEGICFVSPLTITRHL